MNELFKSGVDIGHKDLKPADLLRVAYQHKAQNNMQVAKSYYSYLVYRWPGSDETEEALNEIPEDAFASELNSVARPREIRIRKANARESAYPKCDTPESARRAARQGVIVALVVAGFITVGTIFRLISSQDAGDLFGLVDALLFVLIAWGIHRMSRFAAVAGVLLFTFEKLLIMAVDPRGIVSIPEIVIVIAFVNSIRGTYAFKVMEG